MPITNKVTVQKKPVDLVDQFMKLDMMTTDLKEAMDSKMKMTVPKLASIITKYYTNIDPDTINEDLLSSPAKLGSFVIGLVGVNPESLKTDATKAEYFMKKVQQLMSKSSK